MGVDFSGNNGPTAVVLVLDAFGVRTLEYLLEQTSREINLPNLQAMGLGNILQPSFHTRIAPVQQPHGAMAIEQTSATPDSVVGHREMVGVIDSRTYDLFHNGFPCDYI